MRNGASRSRGYTGHGQEYELRMRSRQVARRVEYKSIEEVTKMTKKELRVLEAAVEGMRIVRKQALAENRLEKAADINEHLIQAEQQLHLEG